MSSDPGSNFKGLTKPLITTSPRDYLIPGGLAEILFEEIQFEKQYPILYQVVPEIEIKMYVVCYLELCNPRKTPNFLHKLLAAYH